MAQDAGVPAEVIRRRINRLFEASPHPEALDREYFNSEVVDACRAHGHELSTSHLSEVRRGLKGAGLKVLIPLASFFRVPVGYFLDQDTNEQVEKELSVREQTFAARLQAELDAQEDRLAAARELQRAMRVTGVTRAAHRAVGGLANREAAAAMRDLAQALLNSHAGEDEDEDEDEDI